MAVKTSSPKTIKPLIPPDETMWQKYSPHYEAPLAGATSLFLHGAIIGILAVGGIAALFAANLDATRPARMDVVMLEGGGAGLEGLSGEAGLPGDPDAGAPKTEQITPLDAPQPDRPPMPRPPSDPLPDLSLPLIDVGNAAPSDLVLELQKTAQEADDLVKKEMKIPQAPITKPEGKKPGPLGAGNPKGKGGLGGPGDGPGIGKKKGAGLGGGLPGGRDKTDQEIKASRWRFDLSGDGKEHARKLSAIGFTVALADPRGGFVLVTDLNRRPAELQKSDLAPFKDAVKWYNTRPDSMQKLARELQLPFTPKFVVLLLPKEREQKMADEEGRFAKANRRDLKTVQATWFDFRLLNGAYDPAVLKQD